MPRPKGDLQLAFGYWIVSHKPALKRWLALTVMAFIGGSLLWAGFFFSVFFRQQSTLDTGLAQAAGRLDRLTIGIEQPAELEAGAVAILTRDRQHIDLVSTLKNPNIAWGADTVRYHWKLGEQETANETGFVNPNNSRPIIGLNISVSNMPASATLEIDGVEWTRAGSASLPPASFVTDGVTLSPTTISIGGQSITTVNLKATVINRSVYNFFRVAVPVIVYAGDRIVAADFLNLERWPTLTSRTIASSWSYPVSGATRADIDPQVSQFAADNIYR